MLNQSSPAGFKTNQIAVFGGGCFWCTEAVFKMLRGVKSVLPGYAGGVTDNPTYEEVSEGKNGHVEVVQVEYDSHQVQYRDLLLVFFASHDPTTINRQGNDVGSQYRSVIFYTTPEQKEIAEKFIKDINKSDETGASIVTTVEPLKKFYPAEIYHQDYFANNSDQTYCRLVINPKLEKVRKEFAGFLAETEWRRRLTPEQYAVLRQKETETPGTGRYLYERRTGTYNCAACGQPLFSSTAKFDSGTGWPAFTEALPGAVRQVPDDSHGRKQTEVVCARCGSHLGHVFNDGPRERGGRRYCLNSVCLELKPEGGPLPPPV